MTEMHFAILGFPLGHSQSPDLHNEALRFHHIPGDYSKIIINPEEFDKVVSNLKKQSFSGFNITVPYKQRIMPFLDEIDHQAEKINAVNTIKVVDGRWIGYNTDADGFMYPLKAEASIQNALVTGAGGAATAVCYALLNYFPDLILWIANRSHDRLENLRRRLYQLFPKRIINILSPIVSVQEAQPNVDLVVNCTSVGMGETVKFTPLDINILNRCPRIAYDLIYNPTRTKFLIDAQRAGVERCLNGWSMLVHQADCSFKIWTRMPFPDNLYDIS